MVYSVFYIVGCIRKHSCHRISTTTEYLSVSNDRLTKHLVSTKKESLQWYSVSVMNNKDLNVNLKF